MALAWFSSTLPSESELLNITSLDIEGKIYVCYTMYKGVPNRFVYAENVKPLVFNEAAAYGEWPIDGYLVHEVRYLWQ
ncbi:hypothetical protein CLPUN_19720 [Clostridium puniceum]|uniref:Uncharacterized protein n=1 Tax=Clostridium puniceum TaxID=29367 RepID=A0A1S8TKQ1_9CLOT|nr:hypothetical protein [Clostridium puniceum]OOM78363.1 hypothetical protein CLPUN_19720 [Clostridium puniceum]